MFDIHIPHPKYDLTRYSTKQLKAWMEETYLYALEHNPHGDDFSRLMTVPDDAVEAYEMSWDCYVIMRDRGECANELTHLRSMVWYDWVVSCC
jgi:hypothetical protein